MIKLFLLIFLFSFAHAENMNSDPLNGIMKEAVLFFTLFAIMSIISIIISRKHAKNYELKNPLDERKATARKRKIIERYLDSFSIKINGKDAILLKISKHLENKVINEEEFEMLKEILNSEY